MSIHVMGSRWRSYLALIYCINVWLSLGRRQISCSLSLSRNSPPKLTTHTHTALGSRTTCCFFLLLIEKGAPVMIFWSRDFIIEQLILFILACQLLVIIMIAWVSAHLVGMSDFNLTEKPYVLNTRDDFHECTKERVNVDCFASACRGRGRQGEGRNEGDDEPSYENKICDFWY